MGIIPKKLLDSLFIDQMAAVFSVKVWELWSFLDIISIYGEGYVFT